MRLPGLLRTPVAGVLAALACFLLVVGVVGATGDPARRPSAAAPERPAARHAPHHEAPAACRLPCRLPGGRTKVFDHRFLVAYYGTPQTASLGVLGSGTPEDVSRRLRRAAAPFHRRGQRVQVVYELIVTVADGSAGPDGDHSHEIPRRYVQQWIRLAHRTGALLLLDLQPGGTGFRTIARRWAWALRDPWVGLALDPEWRMHGGEVPGRRIGHVDAGEVNRTTAWLDRFTAHRHLPQKLLVLHQFRTSMIRRPALIRRRAHLALVQHVDGFGPPRAKRATYHAVARPRQFRMGFKLFYRYDHPRLTARQVLALRPRVDFVSFQ